MSNVIALIPARGGSKGIKHKNIANLAGKPLIAHTIAAAKNSNYLNAVYVSSDDAEILSIARHENAECIIRDSALAQDTSPTDPVIAEFIQQAKLRDDDIIILLQPTSPLRQSQHIDEAFELFKKNSECHALFSVCAADNKYLYAFLGADPYLTPVVPEYMKISRRQDLPNIYLPNGAIYIFSVAHFSRDKKIPRTNIIAYTMNAQDSIDIDTLDDLQQAERHLTNRTRDDL